MVVWLIVGADTRMVAVLQYMRLLPVVAPAPLLVRFVLAPQGAYESVGAKEVEAVTTLGGALFTVGVAAVGAAIATRARIPSGALIGPLVLCAVLISTGLAGRGDRREPAGSASALAVGRGGVLDSDAEGGRLVRLDPRMGAVGRVLALGGSPGSIAIAHGSARTSDTSKGTVTPIVA